MIDREHARTPEGVTELPFEFRLEALKDQKLYETYHGVFVNIQYILQVDIARPLLARNLNKRLEFIVEVPVCWSGLERSLSISRSRSRSDPDRVCVCVWCLGAGGYFG